jgi:hypothetical protein
MDILKHPYVATQWLGFCTCPSIMVRVICLLICETQCIVKIGGGSYDFLFLQMAQTLQMVHRNVTDFTQM